MKAREELNKLIEAQENQEILKSSREYKNTKLLNKLKTD